MTAGGLLAYSTLALKQAAARSDIETQLSQLTGLPVFVAGSASFSLLPRTQISLTDIRVGPRTGDADAVMEIDGIVADLDLWEALWGRTRIERLTLVRPELLSTAGFVEETEPKALAALPTDAQGLPYQPLSLYFGAFLSRFGDLRSLEIRDGVFRMAPGPGSLGISNANLIVAWPSKTSAARMTGSYVWNGQPTDISLRIAAPLDFLAGTRSALDLTLGSPPLTASFDGEAAIGASASYSGILAIATPSLTHSIRWLGDPKAVLPEIGPLSLQARLEGNGRKLNLRDAKVSVDGFTGLGALELLLREGKRAAIAGTLAFERLDLTGFAEAVAPLPQTALDMQRRIPVDFIRDVDLDLRLSAADGAIGTLPISDFAATVMFKDGVATLDLGDVSVLGGQAQARVSVDSTVAPPAAKGVASLSGVDTASLLTAIGVNGIAVSGASDVHADYSMPVTSWADLSRRSEVAVSITTRNGTLSGFDPQIMTSEAAKPLALAATENSISFQSLRAKLRSEGPLIDVDSFDLQGSFGKLTAAGSLSATSRRLDLSGSIEPSTAADGVPLGGDVGPETSHFGLQGIWPNPTVSKTQPIRPI